jgi:signal transduction histidine kinase
VILDFTDNGAGIAPENLLKIFDLYFTTKYDGTGIGLANVKKTVEENLKGQIEVNSEPRKGTRFRLRIPR